MKWRARGERGHVMATAFRVSGPVIKSGLEGILDVWAVFVRSVHITWGEMLFYSSRMAWGGVYFIMCPT
jgi:hypothetical protein